jgi:hypothetical protein
MSKRRPRRATRQAVLPSSANSCWPSHALAGYAGGRKGENAGRGTGKLVFRPYRESEEVDSMACAERSGAGWAYG